MPKQTAFCDIHLHPSMISKGDVCYRIFPRHVNMKGKICCSHPHCRKFINYYSNSTHSLWVRWDHTGWSVGKKLIPVFHPGWASNDPRLTIRGRK